MSPINSVWVTDQFIPNTGILKRHSHLWDISAELMGWTEVQGLVDFNLRLRGAFFPPHRKVMGETSASYADTHTFSYNRLSSNSRILVIVSSILEEDKSLFWAHLYCKCVDEVLQSLRILLNKSLNYQRDYQRH